MGLGLRSDIFSGIFEDVCKVLLPEKHLISVSSSEDCPSVPSWGSRAGVWGELHSSRQVLDQLVSAGAQLKKFPQGLRPFGSSHVLQNKSSMRKRHLERARSRAFLVVGGWRGPWLLTPWHCQTARLFVLSRRRVLHAPALLEMVYMSGPTGSVIAEALVCWLWDMAGAEKQL